MARPRAPKPTDLQVQLRAAWAAYRARVRPAWVQAPHAERTYLRSLDQPAYSMARRKITQVLAGSWDAWVAEVRKLVGRDARIEVLGWGPTRVPVCCLVRGPKGEVAMDEWVVGKPERADAAAQERLGALARARIADGLAERTTDEERLYAKMVAALREAREKMILKERSLDRRRRVKRESDEYRELTQTSYLAHGRADRCMRRAVAYKNKLSARGLVYDLTAVETPAP